LAGVYDGMWREGFKHGKGSFHNKNGVLTYEGEWECGEPHGIGKIYNQWGELKYEGELVKGRTKHGKYWSDYKNVR